MDTSELVLRTHLRGENMIHINMYNRSILVSIIWKATSYKNDAIIDKQSSIN